MGQRFDTRASHEDEERDAVKIKAEENKMKQTQAEESEEEDQDATKMKAWPCTSLEGLTKNGAMSMMPSES